MCRSAAYLRVPQKAHKQMLKGEACPETISVLPLFFSFGADSFGAGPIYLLWGLISAHYDTPNEAL